ncbi:hypothetical protein K457DRAFT_1001994 [Linnemannia elongata AG-77]|uniref:REJ domain-containing protein n=1 Tax=Linnemannia elongata AG-77 TaxID=1314771 RepID=A0A197KFC4_9FUNG|nr:hypothetical protein K457DRAFT_1001994 [Linnemannia elongata AG-77]
MASFFSSFLSHCLVLSLSLSFSLSLSLSPSLCVFLSFSSIFLSLFLSFSLSLSLTLSLSHSLPSPLSFSLFFSLRLFLITHPLLTPTHSLPTLLFSLYPSAIEGITCQTNSNWSKLWSFFVYDEQDTVFSHRLHIGLISVSFWV